MQTALIVDDSVVGRMITSRIVRSAGWDVIEVTSGVDALTAASVESPDIVLLDLLMPGMNGMEVLRILANGKRRLPVVVVTADVQETTRDECLRLGAVAVLTKPPSHRAITGILSSISSEAV